MTDTLPDGRTRQIMSVFAANTAGAHCGMCGAKVCLIAVDQPLKSRMRNR